MCVRIAGDKSCQLIHVAAESFRSGKTVRLATCFVDGGLTRVRRGRISNFVVVKVLRSEDPAFKPGDHLYGIGGQ